MLAPNDELKGRGRAVGAIPGERQRVSGPGARLWEWHCFGCFAVVIEERSQVAGAANGIGWPREYPGMRSEGK
jgi:hypothetical protein